MIKIDWLDTFNRLHDAAQRRQDVLHRLRRLQDTTEGDIELTDEQEGAFAIVRDFAEGDHRLAVTHLVEYAQHVPMDRLAQLSTDARTKLGTRLATLGANQGDGSVLAAGLALGAVPYPLLSNPQVVKRAELLDLVLAECTAERLNAPSNDQGLLVWETVMWCGKPSCRRSRPTTRTGTTSVWRTWRTSWCPVWPRPVRTSSGPFWARDRANATTAH